MSDRRKTITLQLALWSIIIFTSCFTGMTIRLNQELAIKRIKSIKAAQETYKATKGAGRYGTMGDLIDAGLIDTGVGDGNTKGYRFAIRLNDGGYEVVAVPEIYGEKGTGIASYYLDQTGVLRGSNTGLEASKNDIPIVLIKD